MQKEVPFNLAMESRYPEQVTVCVARDQQGKYNPITIGWMMPTSFKPPMLAVSIGKARYSIEAFRNTGEFVLAFPSEAQAADAKLFGTRTGRTVDKLAIAGTSVEPARLINSRLLTDAVANFECKVVQEIETGDHIIFIGEVLASYMTENPAGRLYTLVKSLHMGGLAQKPATISP